MARPKKAKLLIPKTAKDCNVSEELTEDVIDFFYSNLRGKLESLEYPIIKIPLLGNMVMNKGKIVTSIRLLTNKVESEKTSDFKSMKKYNLYKSKLDLQIKALSLLKKIDHEKQQRKEVLGKS